MPKRIPLTTIRLVRDGQRIVPPIGKVFDFTQAELDDIKRVAPDSVRHPINEDPEVEAKVAEESGSKGKGRGKKAEAEAGEDAGGEGKGEDL